MAGLGIKLFQDGSTLTAAEINGYLMDQSVCVFEDETDRNNSFGGSNEPLLSEGRVCYLKNREIIQYYNGTQWIDSEQFSVSLNSQVSPGILQLDRLVDGTAGQIIVCDSTGTPTYVTLTGDASISSSGQLTIGSTALILGAETVGFYVERIAGTANQITVTGSGAESASVTLSLPQDIHTAANPTFAGATIDAVRVGVTTANEIDTTSGNLVLDSTGGTVSVDDNLSVSGSVSVSTNLSVSGSVSVVGNIVGHTVPEVATSLTNAIDGKIVEVAGSSVALNTSGGSWVDGTQFTVIATSGALTVTAGSGTTFRASPSLAGGNVKLRAQYSSATFIYKATGSYWYVIGDLTST